MRLLVFLPHLPDGLGAVDRFASVIVRPHDFGHLRAQLGCEVLICRVKNCMARIDTSAMSVDSAALATGVGNDRLDAGALA